MSSYPASRRALTALLGNPDLAERYSRHGPPLVARIRLLRDHGTRSGLKWSSGQGAPFPLQPGTSVDAHINEEAQTPLDVVFGKQ